MTSPRVAAARLTALVFVLVLVLAGCATDTGARDSANTAPAMSAQEIAALTNEYVGPGTIVALGRPGEYLIVAADGGRWTDDGGRTWHRATNPVRKLVQPSAHPAQPDRVWVPSEDGVLRSDDRGVTWTRTAAAPPFIRRVVAGGVGQRVFVTPVGDDARVEVSDDGGATTRPIPGAAFTVGVSPADPRVLLVLGDRDHTILRRSTDGGVTYTDAGAGLPPDDAVAALAFDVLDPSTVVAVTFGRPTNDARLSVGVSRDGGLTFTTRPLELDGVDAIGVRDGLALILGTRVLASEPRVLVRVDAASIDDVEQRTIGPATASAGQFRVASLATNRDEILVLDYVTGAVRRTVDGRTWTAP